MWGRVPHLDYSVHEGHTIQQGLPHGQVADIQLVLSDACKCALQASTDTLRWVVGELDGGLRDSEMSEDHTWIGDHIQELKYTKIQSSKTTHVCIFEVLKTSIEKKEIISNPFVVVPAAE